MPAPRCMWTLSAPVWDRALVDSLPSMSDDLREHDQRLLTDATYRRACWLANPTLTRFEVEGVLPGDEPETPLESPLKSPETPLAADALRWPLTAGYDTGESAP